MSYVRLAINLYLCRANTRLAALPDDPSTHPVGPVLALLTLSPFFLFSAYTAVIVINRPLSVVNLLVGQLGNEAWNGVLKKSLRGERPWVVGDGWGMPSSHSQVSRRGGINRSSGVRGSVDDSVSWKSSVVFLDA